MILLFLLLIAACIGEAQAKTITALPGFSKIWNDPSTWDCSCIPQSGDIIIIPSGSEVTSNAEVDLRGSGTTQIIVQDGGSIALFETVIRLDNADGDIVTVEDGGDIFSFMGSGVAFDGDPYDFESEPPVLPTVYLPDGLYFGPFTITNRSLPVVLISFMGHSSDDRVLLSWTTSNQENFSHFEIEHSADGELFETMGRIDALTNTSYIQNYTFADYQPLLGNNYYRLKMVDLDATFEYSPLTRVFNSSVDKQVNIFPNPVQRIHPFTLRFNYQPSQGQLFIFTVDGELTYWQKLEEHYSFQVAHELEPGLYVIRIVDSNFTRTERFVVN